MPLSHEHELHRRRASMNWGVGATLAILVVLVFGLTFVKVTRQNLVMPETVPGVTATEGEG